LAYTQGEARKVFENRLKLSEVAIIFEYKDKLSHGKIPDFRETYNVLDQVTWFKQYPYITRQELMQKAQLKVYEPGDEIFRQGQPSPILNVILRGSARAQMTKSDWPKGVNMILKTFFDGQVVGEISDFDAQKDLLTDDMLD
jgi:hypothetical protein